MVSWQDAVLSLLLQHEVAPQHRIRSLAYLLCNIIEFCHNLMRTHILLVKFNKTGPSTYGSHFVFLYSL